MSFNKIMQSSSTSWISERELAKRRRISINKLFEELSTAGLAEFDAETRFRSMAARGSAAKGLKLLDKLDKAFAKRPGPR